MANQITVFTKSPCPQCDATKAYLNKNDVDYKVENIYESELAMSILRKTGLMQAPLIIVQDTETKEVLDHSTGFKIPELKKIVNTQLNYATVSDDSLWDF